MFGTSGIRGPVGSEITGDLALSLGRALGVETDRVVLGRDSRESGQYLLDALAAGLRESGTDVVDLGLAATPTVARAVAWEDADAGVSVTASHNPPADNGFKLWQPSGQAFATADRERIADRIRDGESDLVGWEACGRRESGDGRSRHLEALAEAVDGPLVGAADGDALSAAESLSVVVDVGNGAGGLTADALASMGCAVETLNAQPDGSFPGRPSEPTAEHCETLATVVGETDAAVGIAHDGDADRTRAVAADGTFLSGDVLLAIFARAAASEGDTVAVPVDTSLAVEDFLASAGIETTRTPVGDVHVAEATRKPGVVFGGEPSGAWIWPAETRCPDGPLAACRVVALAADRPLAEREAEIPTYPIRREAFPVEDKAAAMATVETGHETLTAGRDATVSRLDGVRVDLGDAWFLVRPSGTEPVVRVTAEARSAERTDEVFELARNLLPASAS